jgi:cytochrome c556
MPISKFTVIAGSAVLGLSAIAYAATPAQTITARQTNFKSIGKATKTIFDELKKDTPSIDVVRANTKIISNLSGKVPAWFPAKSGPEAGVKTAALPTIWIKNAEFKRAAAAFGKAAKALDTTAKKGDLAAVGKVVQGLGATCKGCHDSFKAKDN